MTNNNNGRDLLLEDIVVDTNGTTGDGNRATLGFTGTNPMSAKFYRAYGPTPTEARHNLIDVMVKDLQRLK